MRDSFQRLRHDAAPMLRKAAGHAAGHAAVVTVLGRIVAGAAVVSWFAGTWLGWHELRVVALTATVLLLLAVPFVLGAASLGVTLGARPARVVVGETASGSVTARNGTGRRAFGQRIEAPVGDVVLAVDVPSLQPGGEHDEVFAIGTARRGVITVGPASIVRGDPLGLLRRVAPSADAVEVFVHPRTVAVGGLGAGLLRDLEGQPTRDLSDNDVSFHALRPYVAGDDRRHVHWRTVARTGSWMVRQFVDTRTTRLVVVVSSSGVDWADEDTFETGVSAAGSVALRCVHDGLGVTLVAGTRTVAGGNSRRILDGLSRVVHNEAGTDLLTLAGRAAAVVPDASAAILVTGASTPLGRIRVAAGRFGADTRTVAVRVEPGREPSVRKAGQLSILTIATLEDLPRVLRAVNQP